MEEENKKPWYLPDIPPVTVTLGVGGKNERTLLGSAALSEPTDSLWVTISEAMDFPEAVLLFSDSTMTEAIRCDYSVMDVRQFNGYTKLLGINTDASNKIEVRLTRP